MNARTDSEPNTTKNRTTVEPKSEREIVVTRTFDAPARIVFQAWTTPELFRRWWVPKSMPLPLLSYEADIRVGGGYRLVFDVDDTKTMAFFGKYLEVTPHSRIVWTNDESGEDGAVTTVTLEEKGDKTLHGAARALSLEGSSRCCPGLRRVRRDGRDVRATRRGARHAGRGGSSIVSRASRDWRVSSPCSQQRRDRRVAPRSLLYQSKSR